MNKKICQMVTDRLIDEMEKGVIPWDKPWTGTGAGAISHSTGKPYSLLNQFILSRPGEYITFTQCKAEGGSVRKGEKGKPVVFWKQIAIDEEQPDGSKEKKLIPMLKYYTVFHIDQCDGIKPKYPIETRAHLDPIAEAETVVSLYESREALTIERGELSDKAFYSPARDYIQVPRLDQYTRPEEYYSTLFHEMTHSTGHKSRLNRFTGSAANAAFGSEEYSREELVAEIGAATLNNHCGIETPHSLRNSAAYIQGWMKAIKNDPTMIVTAAGKAEKAFNYIIGDEDEPTGTDPETTTETPAATVEAVTKTAPAPTGDKSNRCQIAGVKANRSQVAAAKRLLKQVPIGKPEFLGTWAENGRNCFCNNYYGIRSTLFFPGAPVVPGWPGMAKVMKPLADYTTELPIPTVAELKQHITDCKNAGKKKPYIYDFGPDLPAVNVQYLLDMITLLPFPTVYISSEKPLINPLYFNAETGDGLLLPVRKNPSK